VGLYSPVRRAYDVQLPDNTLARRLTIPYYGPGGEGNKMLTVEQGPPTYLRQLEVDVGAMRSFAMHASKPWADLETQLTVIPLPSSGYRIQGTIHHRGDVALRNCALVWNAVPVVIDDLAAGSTQHIDAQFSFSTSKPPYELIEMLLGQPTIGRQERRTRDRKREILNSIFFPDRRPWTGPMSSQTSLQGPTLLAWADSSPLHVDVQGAPEAVNATTLLIVPLSAAPPDPNATIIQRDTMAWLPTHEDANLVGSRTSY
jgi:hypothetical protein